MGFILYILSLILGFVFSTIGMLYGFYVSFRNNGFLKGLSVIDNKFRKMAISQDQSGNVKCGEWFNVILRENNGAIFGCEDETISSVLGKNIKTDTLTKEGWWLNNNVLDKIERNHCIDAIENVE